MSDQEVPESENDKTSQANTGVAVPQYTTPPLTWQQVQHNEIMHWGANNPERGDQVVPWYWRPWQTEVQRRGGKRKSKKSRKPRKSRKSKKSKKSRKNKKDRRTRRKQKYRKLNKKKVRKTRNLYVGG